ncbi:MAG TPA: hypothetical protein VGI97_13345 [Gemmatimonadaceae bacterium]|jgi:hypothetical protein
MKWLRWSGVAFVTGALAVGTSPASAQGARCDSPCKIILLPLIKPDDHPVPLTDPVADLILGSYKPYMYYQVDSVARLLTGARQPYPDELLDSRINGEVIATIIVDSLGHAVPQSLAVLYATDSLFVRVVRSQLANMRFTPAKLGERHVAQIVRQNFDFVPPRR